MIRNANSMNEAEMIENVKQSTDSALKALKIFHQSLVQARMSESISSYRTMCNTLAGQRIWMLNKDNVAVENNFRELSEVAQQIVGVLSPYVNSFEKIRSLDFSHGVPNGEDNKDISEPLKVNDEDQKKVRDQANSTKVEENAILDVIKSHKGKISLTKLKNQTKLRKKDLESLLAELYSENLVAEKIVSGRRMVVLTVNT